MLSQLTIHRKNVLNLTLADIAKRTGFAISRLSDFEHGREPAVKDKPRLAEGYSISECRLCEWMGWQNKKNNNKIGIKR